MRLNVWLGALVSAAAVALLLYRIDFGEVAQAFRTAHYGWILPGVLVTLALVFIRAWRWRYLLRDDLQASFQGRLSATFIGFMANGLLPARMGEFVRAWCLGHREGKSKSGIFASIVVERLLDGMWVLLYLAIALWVVPFPEGRAGEGALLGGWSLRTALRWAGLLSLVFYAGVISFLAFLRFAHEKTLRVLDGFLRLLSRRFAARARRAADGFIRGIYVPDTGERCAMALFFTCLLWVVGLGANYFTLRAFGLSLPWHAPVFLLVLQAIGVMIPSSPGFVGTFHAAAALGVRFYGASEAVALSFAVVIHIVAFLPVILVGLGFLWKENLTLGRIASTREATVP